MRSERVVRPRSTKWRLLHGAVALVALLAAISLPAFGQPTVVSTVPASGSGSTQSFAVTVADPGGAAAITTVVFLINNGLSGANGCWLLYSRSANTFQLANDAATGFSAPVTLGTASLLSNSQCSVNAANASTSTSGNNLTVKFPLTFAFGFAGVKTSFALVYDSTQNSGWVSTGSWTVPGSGPPTVMSTLPSSGSGNSQTFALTVADGSGPPAITFVSFLINNGLNGAGACWVLYSRSANTLQLANDAGSGFSAPVTIGTATPLSNSQCSVSVATASTGTNGTTLSLNLPLTFTNAFAGAKSTFGIAYDSANQNSGWQGTGSWTVTAPPGPTVISTAPSSGSGSSQSFAVTVSDPGGAAAIATVSFLVNNGLNGANGCWLLYSRSANTFQLANDAANGFSAPVTLGTASTLSNSQCSVNAAAASTTTNGNSLTVNIPLTFAFGFAGNKSTFAIVYDATQNSGWVGTGSWTVPASGAPTVISTFPSSGSGSSQTFATTVADGSGSAAITFVSFLVGNGLNGANACWVLYTHAFNTLQLANDAGTGFSAPVTIGTASSLSNSQCTVNAGTASVTTSGTTLTVNVPLTFAFAFNGAKQTFGLAYDSTSNSGWVLTGAWTVQAPPPPVPEPTPPPTTPNTSIGGFTTMSATMRVKASPDECYKGLGQNVKWDFINQANPSQPCAAGKIPKVDQGYVWGSTIINGIAYFGTQANAQCIGEGALSKNPAGPAPYQTDTWSCEFGVSPYAQPNGPLPPQIGDQRPPRMYSYNITTHVVTDITPKLGGTPGSYCSPSGPNPLCIDQLWLSVRGVRTATSYTEPATGKTYLIISGPALVQGSNALDFFAYDVAAQKWVAKYQYVGYNDMRHWITVGGKLYAPVGKPANLGGALVQYTGSFAVLPDPPVPGSGNNYNQIPLCGTTSPTIPPQAAANSQCFAFQDVGDFDGVGTDVVLHEGRLFAATWPPPGYGSIFMSPPIPAGGFGQPNPSPQPWTRVWSISANYDPDPLVASTIGTGALADFNGVLYWGTMVYGIAGTGKWFNTYGVPTDPQALNLAIINTFRTATLFSGTNFTTGNPSINLLYGQSSFYVWNPTTSQWVLTPNNQFGARPLYGASGFGNPYNNYIWTMAIFNNKLYVGTMDWGYTAADAFAFVAQGQGQPFPNITQLIPVQQYGADLYTFSNTTSAANAESVSGLGNYLNYGIRAMLVNGSTSILFGTAGPMNLASTSPTTPHGGWELIEAIPASQPQGR